MKYLRKYTVWASIPLSIILHFLYSINGGNFTLFMVNFFLGNAIDMSGLLVMSSWLFSLIWTGYMVWNHQRPQINQSGGLYHIEGLRSGVLSPISAQAYNEDSHRITGRSPAQSLPKVAKANSNELPELVITSISGNFSHNGGKKDTSSPSPAELSAGAAPTSLANLHTAIKGESFASDEMKLKFKNNLNRFAKKRTEAQN